MITRLPTGLADLRFRAPADRPIAIVNLPRYADSAQVDGRAMSGRAAYAEYVRRIERTVVTQGGRPAFRARGSVALAGAAEPGRAGPGRDEVIIVWYPSRRAFDRFVESPEYTANAELGLSALDDARIVAVLAPQRIGRLVAAVYGLAIRMGLDSLTLAR